MFSNDDGVINFDKLVAFKEAVKKPESLKDELKGLEVQEVNEIFREPDPLLDDFDDDILLN